MHCQAILKSSPNHLHDNGIVQIYNLTQIAEQIISVCTHCPMRCQMKLEQSDLCLYLNVPFVGEHIALRQSIDHQYDDCHVNKQALHVIFFAI